MKGFKNVNTIKTGKLERYRQSPFIGIKDLEVIKPEDAKAKTESEFYLKNFKWNDLPFFDIILVANVDGNDKNSRSEMSIENIKIQSYGNSEGVDSTEMNEMVKFIALGELKPFKKIKTE